MDHKELGPGPGARVSEPVRRGESGRGGRMARSEAGVVLSGATRAVEGVQKGPGAGTSGPRVWQSVWSPVSIVLTVTTSAPAPLSHSHPAPAPASILPRPWSGPGLRSRSNSNLSPSEHLSSNVVPIPQPSLRS